MPISNRKVRHVWNANSYKGQFGLEIEVEGSSLPTSLSNEVTAHWSAKGDHSLRDDGVEYVCRQPLSLSTLETALKNLFKYVKEKGTIKWSYRTSIHVHYNVAEYTLSQIFQILAAYYLIEELMFEHGAGPKRLDNPYCLKLSDAPEVFYDLSNVKTTAGLSSIMTHDLKYCALNILTLARFNSLEFRALRGTDDINLILEWCVLIENLITKAAAFKEPKAILDYLDDVGPDRFIEFFAGPLAMKFKKLEDFRGKIYKNYSYVFSLTQELAFKEPDRKKKYVDKSNFLGYSLQQNLNNTQIIPNIAPVMSNTQDDSSDSIDAFWGPIEQINPDEQ